MFLTSNQITLNTQEEYFGELTPFNFENETQESLQYFLKENGYLFLKNYLNKELIQSARTELLQKYAIIGEIDDRNDLNLAVYGENVTYCNINIRAFVNSLLSGYYFKLLTGSDQLLKITEILLGEPTQSFDFQWPRLVRPKEGCGVHCDGPYMNRGTTNILTTWVPIGNVPKELGALTILEKSHINPKLIDYLSKDVTIDKLGWYSTNPLEVQQNLGGKWLSANFEMGDLLIFPMETLHCALDNQTSNCRLTMDLRFQKKSDLKDERWFGPERSFHGKNKVFFPGLGTWGNENMKDEWKEVDEFGKLIIL